MGASIRRLRHFVSRWPFLGFIGTREPVPAPPRPSDGVAVMFRECEGVCDPTAEQIEAEERERADRFKSDQLLPIMGFGGGSPSPPS
jgi:hypothetical protein